MIDLSKKRLKNRVGIDLTKIQDIDPRKIEFISSNTVVSSFVKTYEVDTTGGNVTVTFDLTNEVYNTAQIWNFKKLVAPNRLIISVNGGTIDGAANQTIRRRFSNLSVQYDGINFIIL